MQGMLHAASPSLDIFVEWFCTLLWAAQARTIEIALKLRHLALQQVQFVLNLVPVFRIRRRVFTHCDGRPVFR